MRNVSRALLLLLPIALAAPGFVVDFIEPFSETPAQNNDTLADADSFELVKRQNNCASVPGYRACANLNAPGLCCRTTEVCSADAVNNVACCPINAACTGTLSSPVIPGQTASPISTSSFVFASTTTSMPAGPTQSSFVQSGTGAGQRSMVPNSFYPFPYIPTTYANAAACSSAYTSCQADAASCTSALANGLPGVTVSGPNGGATITAIASLGTPAASSICQSLSSQACSGLVVEACARFGNGGSINAAKTACGNMYGIGAGVAVGIAGQLLR